MDPGSGFCNPEDIKKFQEKLEKGIIVRCTSLVAHCKRAFNRNNNEPSIFINYKRLVAACPFSNFSFFHGFRLLSRLLCQGTLRTRNNFQVKAKEDYYSIIKKWDQGQKSETCISASLNPSSIIIPE